MTAQSPQLISVPFLDLAALHAPLKEQILREIGEIIDSSAFVSGAPVEAFEAAFASYCDAPHCVGLSSGLDALRLGLLAGGVGPGDEVIVPANTFIATFEAVTQVGAVPVPVDADERDWNLDVVAASAAVGSRTRALLPVHLYGQVADMDALMPVAAARDLFVLEDACQAHGAARGGRRAGSIGHAAAFSFYPGKNLGAFGDGGALVTSDADLAAVARSLREHGQRAKYDHERVGYTARLDTIQAVVLLRKLERLDEWNADRRKVAGFFSQALDGVGDLVLPPVVDGEHVFHLYVVRTAKPAALADFLRGSGIGTGRHYPEPPHLSTAYSHLGYGEGDFPVTERLARECLSLPIFPGMSEEQQEHVVATVAAYFDRG